MAVETRDDRARPSLWNDPNGRAVIYQILLIALVLGVAWYLVSNTLANLERQQIASGFGFLDRESGFQISESLVPYAASDTYGRAFVVGLLNTFKVAVIGIVIATVLGTVIGIARLSSNWLVAKLASSYVEVLRNIPLLLQLFFWYGAITVSLPHPRDALNPVDGVFLSNRGFKVPLPEPHIGFTLLAVGLVAGLVGAWAVGRWAEARRNRTGQPFPSLGVGAGLIVGLPILGWLVGGAPTALDMPELGRFRFTGGMTLTPEFAALLFGLSTYTASFIAEIVRSGILAVNWGQSEAGLSLGLSRGTVLRLIVLPQALRVIVPPTTSQYLNLTKNSSLAVAIGYPDLVHVGNTTLNQTGQAIEAISIFMAVYLSISLAISYVMNRYNERIALVER